MGRAIDMENSIHKLEARLSDIEDILEMLSKEPEKPKKKVKEKKVGKQNSKDK